MTVTDALVRMNEGGPIGRTGAVLESFWRRLHQMEQMLQPMALEGYGDWCGILGLPPAEGDPNRE